jgi:hypothetical protein
MQCNLQDQPVVVNRRRALHLKVVCKCPGRLWMCVCLCRLHAEAMLLARYRSASAWDDMHGLRSDRLVPGGGTD